MKLKAIDLFAGAGGFSTGARAAGVDVAWAANHWREAVDVHKANHPDTDHKCQDLQQADWRLVPEHDLLLASPACQGHSPARGKDRPHHDATRSTAWAVIAAAEFHRPRAIIVENVPHFARWVLYRVWCDALRELGYKVTARIINAADLSVPQNRPRLFVTASRERAIHIDPPRGPHVAASTILDDSRRSWSPVEGHAERTLGRIEEGRRQYGSRFLLAYYGSEEGGRSIDRPIGTITTRDRHAVIDGDRMGMITVEESRAAMGFPLGYHLPSSHKLAMHMLGNAVCPPAAEYVVRAVAASLA